MAEEGLADNGSKDELQEIMEHISDGNHFLLSGGAGSGKTYTLVEVIRNIYEAYPNVSIACMTYTNSAVREIEERVNNKSLKVSTIHDFLWDNTKNFQKELKNSLVSLVNDPETKIQIRGHESISIDFFDHLKDGIQYKEYLRIEEGIISHDEVLTLTNHIFLTYPKICGILKDKYPFILIDEYQDTNAQVVQIFLEHLKKSNKKNVIGFFGDAMQSIYDDGIGNLDGYKGNGDGQVREVKKEQNRRNPLSVVNLANRLRTDGLVQEPSIDKSAPNILENGEVRVGDIKFLYSSDYDLDAVRNHLGWDFNNAKETKELNLTHNLIAEKAGFPNLMEIYDKERILDFKYKVRKYIRDNDIKDDFSGLTFGQVLAKSSVNISPRGVEHRFIEENPDLYETALNQDWEIFSKIYVDKEQLIDDKKQDVDEESKKGSQRDNLIKHLFKIENCLYLYRTGEYNEFLKRTGFKVYSIRDKVRLKKHIELLSVTEDNTIDEVINLADELGICVKDDRYLKFVEEKSYLYDRVKKVRYSEFKFLYDYLEGFTPFSTQHKTKGTEFDNVLVILDNGRWNKYNFGYLFAEAGTQSVLERTQKIFYVCCTRSKENLAVFYHNPDQSIINKAGEWFGRENMINLDS